MYVILVLIHNCSQNHQYALKLQDPFPPGWEPFFINCNDSSVEGIKSTSASGKNVIGVQFHPESAGGPLDTIEVRPSQSFKSNRVLTMLYQMFTDFVNDCRAIRSSQGVGTQPNAQIPTDSSLNVPSKSSSTINVFA